MNIETTKRGFEILTHPAYPPLSGDSRIAGQSSIVGDYPDAMVRPGTSALWISSHHHLNREEVADFIKHLQNWLDTGSLSTTDA